ncbi:EamA family transporter RarD [Streptomyces sp. N2-109]|uniref:EamA family transporter RarD n=1 Tax=Streptomyces gossypii TaxID=2883101 RepID=A0ABT2JW80_9ACTN|nr:EamA family transporter RarD [Streptomyces gossypii]MCT2592155.1 EamA family transporter RarD [Streptomyces gossypii]
MQPTSETRTGLIFGFTAYGLWGLLPLYWHLLESTGATEMLAHRMLWSLPTAALILTLARRWSWIRPLLREPRKLGLVLLATTVISLNWAMFIWAVTSDRVLEASLGYFINPLVSIAFGVLLLRERLRPAQWSAVGIGVVAVIVLAIGYGQVPWLSIGLAITFATYGLIKKHVKLGGLEGFSAETSLQFLPALVFLIWLSARGDSTFTTDGAGHALLLAGTGLATAAPLIFFGAAAVRLPLSTIGLLQYMAPAFMFVLGLLVFHEPMPVERLAGFLLIWTALCVLTWDALRNAHRGRAALRATAAAAEAEAEAAHPSAATASNPGGQGPAASPATAATASGPDRRRGEEHAAR